jgi:DNA-binding response OmpR family regulator
LSRTVLLIEDEAVIVEALVFLLENEGMTVFTRSDGADALEKARSVSPHVIIIDVMLPNRSGHDILADLRADPHLANVAVLMLTARSQARDREAALDAGATRFMTKPFANREIVSVVRELVSGYI